MRNLLIVIVVAMWPATSVLAEPAANPKDKFATPDHQLPLKHAGRSSACAGYGPGFVKVEGSDTCVKLGGAVRIDGGASTGGR